MECGGNGQSLSFQEESSHTYTLKLSYSRILSCIKKEKKKKEIYKIKFELWNSKIHLTQTQKYPPWAHANSVMTCESYHGEHQGITSTMS